MEQVFERKEKKSSHQCLSLICVKPKPNQNYIVQKYRYLSTYFKILILSLASRSSDLSQTPYPPLCGDKKGAACGGQFKKYHLQCTKACGKIFHSLNDFCNVDKKLLSTRMHILYTRRLKALWTTSAPSFAATSAAPLLAIKTSAIAQHMAYVVVKNSLKRRSCDFRAHIYK